MATITSKVCDVDKTHEGGADAYVFGFASEFYTADLCPADAAALEQAIEPYVSVGTPVSARDVGRLANGNGGGYEPSVVRAWAQANGIAVGSQGRVAADVVDKWRAATQPKA